MQQLIEETPAEQEARQRYTARNAELQAQLGTLHRQKNTLYAPASLALVEQQIQAIEAELHQLDEAEEARVAGL